MSPNDCLMLLGVAAMLACAMLAGEKNESVAAPAAVVAPAPDTSAKGRVVVLPGVYNTRFQLRGFVAAVERQHPHLDVEVRTWGAPLRPLHNLGAWERNTATAERLAAELAQWRIDHPDEVLYLVGYSGGGGLAVLTAAALPEHASVDRLVLIAPAISPDYPLEERVLPRVREFVVSYASVMDLQVGWGTAVFGTIDRKKTVSAGAVGFSAPHPRLIEWRWSPAALHLRHRGNHVAYLGRRWQSSALLPAMDPAVDADSLVRLWNAQSPGAATE